MINKNLKILIDSGLVREEFVRKADEFTLASAEFFVVQYVRPEPNKAADRRIGGLLVKHGILTPKLIENTIVASTRDRAERSAYFERHATGDRWAFILGQVASSELKQLVEAKLLGTAVVMRFLNQSPSPLMNNKILAKLALVLTPGASNIIDLGMTTILEYEAAQMAILGHRPFMRTSPHDAFTREKHGLLRGMRATEFLSKKRKQVAAVVPANDPRPVMEQFDSVWQHYAKQSELFREIGAEA